MFKRIGIKILILILAIPSMHAVEIQEIDDNGNPIQYVQSLQDIVDTDTSTAAVNSEHSQSFKQSQTFVRSFSYRKSSKPPFGPRHFFLIALGIYIIFKLKQRSNKQENKQQTAQTKS